MVRHSALRALFAVLAVVSVGAMKQPAPDPSESTDLTLFQEDALDQDAMDMERALFLMAGEDHVPQSPSPGFGTLQTRGSNRQHRGVTMRVRMPSRRIGNLGVDIRGDGERSRVRHPSSTRARVWAKAAILLQI